MPGTKPISEKQLAANRSNAKRSTGPTSPASLKKVSQNALRHGLTGHIAILPDEDRTAFDTFCHELIDEMAPATPMELNLALSIAQDLWRLNRAQAIETNILAVGIADAETNATPDPAHDDPLMQIALANACTFMDHAPKFGLLSLYEQRLNRTAHKNRAKLRQLQTERRQARQIQLEQIVAERREAERKEAKREPAERPNPINDLPTQTASNGFVYANDISAPPPGSQPLEKAA